MTKKAAIEAVRQAKNVFAFVKITDFYGTYIKVDKDDTLEALSSKQYEARKLKIYIAKETYPDATNVYIN